MTPQRHVGSHPCAAPSPLQPCAQPSLRARRPARGSKQYVNGVERRHAARRAALLETGAVESRDVVKEQGPDQPVSTQDRFNGTGDTSGAGEDTVMVTFRFPGALEGQDVSIIGNELLMSLLPFKLSANWSVTVLQQCVDATNVTPMPDGIRFFLGLDGAHRPAEVPRDERFREEHGHGARHDPGKLMGYHAQPCRASR